MKCFRVTPERLERNNRLLGELLIMDGLKHSDIEFYTYLIDLGSDSLEKIINDRKNKIVKS